MIKLKLESTHQHGERFLQYWTITDNDGSEHKVVTDSEWGDYTCEEGAERIFDVAGTPMSAYNIVGCNISAVPIVCLDGEELELSAGWVSDLLAAGCSAFTYCGYEKPEESEEQG